MMNKKGLGAMVFYGVMISVMLWVAFTQTLGPIKDATETARAADQLDCNNASISSAVKGTCVIVDYALFGWAGAMIAMVIGAAGGGLVDLLIRRKKE